MMMTFVRHGPPRAIHAMKAMMWEASVRRILPYMKEKIMFLKASKTVARNLCPPILWRLLAYARHSLAGSQHRGTEDGTEQPASFYDDSFLKHDHWRRPYYQSRFYPKWAVIVDRIQHNGTRCVLDVGCGAGQFAKFLDEKGVAKYVGIDFSPERIKWATEICPRFEFVLGDVFATDLFDSLGYDTVVCTEFLEHVEQDLEVLHRIRPGTRVFATVPNIVGPEHVRHFETIEQVQERYASLFDGFQVDEHLEMRPGRKYFLMDGIKR